MAYLNGSGSAHQALGGIEEALFVMGPDGDPMTPQLAQSWVVHPAGTKVTITIKEGIPWNPPRGAEQLAASFGDLVANDITRWLNTANAATNPGSQTQDAGDYAAVFGEARTIDATRLEIDLVTPIFYGLPLSEFGILGTQAGPQMVRAVDLMGADWAKSNPVGTGPFVLGNCNQGDRCTAHALSAHWRKVPDIAVYTVLEVRDMQTRVALIRNGQIDLSDMDFTLVPGLIAKGFKFLDTQGTTFIGQSVLYPGNLWERSHARSGGLLNPWDSPAYDSDLPWIGDPWQETDAFRVRYTDTDNPPGMTDMEQARLVRLALGTVIDRQEINTDLMGGLGLPLYSEYMGPEYPGWDPERASGVWTSQGARITPSGTKQPVAWLLDDGNLAEAGRLLTLAGYPLVNDERPAFGTQLTLQKYSAEAGELGLPVGDTITNAWASLGITVNQQLVNYGGVVSPRLRDRVEFLPVLKNGDVNSNVFPLDWPYPAADTSITRPNWGVGFETPYLANQHFSIRALQDRAIREEQHLLVADYMLYWQLYNGVFQVPRGLISTDRIASWNANQVHFRSLAGAGNPELIVLNR